MGTPPPPPPPFYNNILYCEHYANTEHMFYYESQLKCAMKTDAIYVHHPFAGEKTGDPPPFNRI